MRAQAAKRQIPFDAYLETLLESQEPSPATHDVSLEDFDEALDALAIDLPGPRALLDEFSRADIYMDHD